MIDRDGGDGLSLRAGPLWPFPCPCGAYTSCHRRLNEELETKESDKTHESKDYVTLLFDPVSEVECLTECQIKTGSK